VVDRDPDQRLSLAIAWEQFAALIPALAPPLLRPGQSLAGEFDHTLEPASGTYLVSGEFDHGSWDLESGEALDEGGDDGDDDDE
jgi:hypothetical protein